MTWSLNSDDSEFWQEAGVADAGEVGRNGMWDWSGKLRSLMLVFVQGRAAE